MAKKKNKDFFENLETLANEKGLEFELVLDAFKEGFVKAFKREYDHESIVFDIDPEKFTFNVYSKLVVVEDFSDLDGDDTTEVLLKDIVNSHPEAKIGDIIEEEVDFETFGRLAANSAKQMFTQNLNKLINSVTFKRFKELEGELVTGTVVSTKERGYIIDIGYNLTTMLPYNVVIGTEKFSVGDKIPLYVFEVEETTKKPKVKVTRINPEFVNRIMYQEIPELADEDIEIVSIARNAGYKTKVAVRSNDSNIDAQAACIGVGGERIQAVAHRLSGEKVEVFKWSEDPRELIENSLQPADVIQVFVLNEVEKKAMVVITDDKLRLALGKGGSNVRLAHKVTGWEIDLKSETDASNEGII